MNLYLHNLTASEIAYNDIGLIVPATGYFNVDTSKINDFLRNSSDLRTDIATPAVYGTDIVLSKDASHTDNFTATEALAILTNGTADEVYYDNGISGLTAETVKTAIDEVNSKVEGISSGLTWKAPVFTITADSQLSGGGTIDLTSMTFPLSDDDAPTQLVVGDFTPGKYVLYKDGTPANDTIYLVVGTDLVEQVGAEDGVNPGFAYVVDNDLLDNPDAAEKYAIYIYTVDDGLMKIGDVDFNAVSLQKAYEGGSTIQLNGTDSLTVATSSGLVEVFTIVETAGNISSVLKATGTGNITLEGTDSADVNVVTDTGDVNITSGASVKLKDSNLTTAVDLAESGVDNFIANEWTDVNTGGTTGNGVFDWSRTNSVSDPTSIMGGLVTLRDDVNEIVSLINTAPTITDGDANGANLVGVKGLSTVTPTAGTEGSDGSLQAMLEGLNDKVDTVSSSAGGKSYADITAFTTAKAAGDTYQLNELVWISDVNRWVEVLTTTTGVTEDADWTYVGSANAPIAGSLVITPDNVKVSNSKIFILPVNNAPSTSASGAMVYDSTLSSAMIYDEVRTKWVSTYKQLLQYGASSADGQYLTVNGVSSGLSGFLMPRNAVITGIVVKQSGGLATKQFEVRVDGTAVGGAGTFSLVAGQYINSSTNISIASGSYVQLFASATGDPVNNVIATIEIAYYK